jgi:hypothetical protein
VIIRRFRRLVVGVEYVLTQLLVWVFCLLVGGRGVEVTVGGVTGLLKQECFRFSWRVRRLVLNVAGICA